jgi:hypothetical protein
VINFRDVITVVSHVCKAYRELERSHARREKLERQERKRQERRRGAIDVEFRVIKE